MTKTWMGCVALSLVGLACGGASAPTAPVGGAASPPKLDEPLGAQAPTAPNDDARFPGGKGTTLVLDQLYAVGKDEIVKSVSQPLATRIARAREILGAQGETLPDGTVVFHAVSARGTTTPFGCFELSVKDKRPAFATRSDHRACGLPYAEDPTSTASVPGPRHTIVKLKEVLAQVISLPPVEAKEAVRKSLFMPDQGDGDDGVWLGIGPRDDDAPITCHALKAGSATKPPRIEKVSLATCSIAWPPPKERFDAGPAVAPTPLTAPLDACVAKCGQKEICVLERVTPVGASTVADDPDVVSARYADGRAATVKLNASCAPIPTTCNPVNASCFFTQLTYTPGVPLPPRDPGPCARDTYTGHAFSKAKNGAPYIMCFARDKPFPSNQSPLGRPASRVALKVGATKAFPLENVASYSVGTTSIVALTAKDDKTLNVVAKRPGSATLVFTDKQGARTSFVIDVK